MTNHTDLLRQALDVFEGAYRDVLLNDAMPTQKLLAIMDALRAALAQPEVVDGNCPDCHGSGEGTAMEGRGPDTYEVTILCPACGGSGATPQAQPAPLDGFGGNLDSAFDAAPAVRGRDERAAFEAWIRKDSGDLSTFGAGSNTHYLNSAVNNAWTGWQARAHGITGDSNG